MTGQDAIKLIDADARLCTWGSKEDGLAYWIKGTAWETKLCGTPERAWELAFSQLLSLSKISEKTS